MAVDGDELSPFTRFTRVVFPVPFDPTTTILMLLQGELWLIFPLRKSKMAAVPSSVTNIGGWNRLNPSKTSVTRFFSRPICVGSFVIWKQRQSHKMSSCDQLQTIILCWYRFWSYKAAKQPPAVLIIVPEYCVRYPSGVAVESWRQTLGMRWVGYDWGRCTIDPETALSPSLLLLR